MKTSVQGLIDIVSHEGICLEWYYDSVGVPTIGIGQTAHDGFDPKTAGPLTIEQVFDLFKEKIKPYENAVDKLNRPLKQHQYDALVSLCYNFGPSNLRKLCKQGRTLNDIGEAIMLYNKPPEIVGRRKKEQKLYKEGIYSNTSGQVLVFPVKNRKPQYSKGYKIDVRPFLMSKTKTATTKQGSIAALIAAGIVAAVSAVISWGNEIIEFIKGLF